MGAEDALRHKVGGKSEKEERIGGLILEIARLVKEFPSLLEKNGGIFSVDTSPGSICRS